MWRKEKPNRIKISEHKPQETLAAVCLRLLCAPLFVVLLALTLISINTQPRKHEQWPEVINCLNSLSHSGKLAAALNVTFRQADKKTLEFRW